MRGQKLICGWDLQTHPKELIYRNTFQKGHTYTHVGAGKVPVSSTWTLALIGTSPSSFYSLFRGCFQTEHLPPILDDRIVLTDSRQNTLLPA
jgi:hypothetical protein